ncbi:hypothetical protein [Pararhodonellum marinum]|uniref:hypothetical protein n=1 Tax=Pararhodonellum marinum TaxID=2755358 RepID=UPI00188FC6A0|nr:hypothetical protein [Pararhodonellum marinum]
MKKNPLLLLMSCLLLAPIITEGQILRQIRRAAEQGASRAVERQVSKEVEKATQRQLEKMFKGLPGPEGSMEGGVNWGKVFGSMEFDAPTEDSYSFDGYTILEITGKEANGKDTDPSTMKSFLSTNPNFTGLEFSETKEKRKSSKEENLIMIYDLKNNAWVMLTNNDGEKSSIAMKIDMDKLMEVAEDMDIDDGDTEEYDLSQYSYKKTGNTRTIHGLSCEEYQADGPDFSANYWITQKPINAWGSFYGQNSPFITDKMRKKNNMEFDELPLGNVMEMVYRSKTDQTVMEMKVIEINESAPITFNMSEYPNMMAGAQAQK